MKTSANAHGSRTDWLGGFAPYDVECNAMRASDLFDRYDRCGFLYPAKRRALAPVLEAVMSTWESSMSGPDDGAVHCCLTSQDLVRNAWASVSLWRTSAHRMHCQHLASSGWPGCSRRLMLAGQDWWNGVGGQFLENWFRAENKYPNRIFGSVPSRLGSERSALERRALFAADREQRGGRVGPVDVHAAADSDGSSVRRTLTRLAGPVVAAAEEFDTGDIALRALHDDYARVGLRRSRDVFVATARGHHDPVGVACAYRGPLGLNFSFLENRCDLWLDAHLDPESRRSVSRTLIDACTGVYDDCDLPYVLVACDERTLGMLVDSVPGEHVRTYTRCVWTREGFWDWYCHVDSFYARIMDYDERRRRRSVPSLMETGS